MASDDSEPNPRGGNFRLRAADRAHKHMFNGGVLTPGSVRETFMRRKDELDRAVVGESARWGDSKVSVPHTRNGSLRKP